MKVINGIPRWEVGDLALVVKITYGVFETVGAVVEVTEISNWPKDPDIRAYVHTGEKVRNTFWYGPNDLTPLWHKNP